MLEEASAAAKKVAEGFSHSWGFVGNSLSATRYFLSSVANTASIGANAASRIGKSIASIKIISCLGIITDLFGIAQLSQLIAKNVRLKDLEGVTLHSFGIAFLVTDILDAITTTAHGALVLTGSSAAQIIGTIAAPIGLTALGIGSGIYSFRLYKCVSLHRKIAILVRGIGSKDLQTKDNSARALKSYLEELFSLTDEEIAAFAEKAKNWEAETTANELKRLLEKKKDKLARYSSPEAVAALEELFNKIKRAEWDPSISIDPTSTEKALRIVLAATEKSITYSTLQLFANALAVISCILIATQVGLPAAFALLAISALIRIISLLYYYLYDPQISFQENVQKLCSWFRERLQLAPKGS
jgi:hypothetical protein